MNHRLLQLLVLLPLVLTGPSKSLGATAQPLRILLTNDDGYLAPGIRAMRTALIDDGHDVFLIAPSTNQSGSGTSISPGGFKVENHGHQVWSVAGRPADAVRYGLGHVMKDNLPDLVISGINFGQNVGADVMLSGTVGAAVTAVLLGVPAIAISAEIKLDEVESQFPSTVLALPKAAQFLTRQLDKDVLPSPGEVININYPAIKNPQGARQTPLATSSLISLDYSQTTEGYWRAGYATATSDAPSSDRAMLSAGFITLSSLRANYSQPSPNQETRAAIAAMVSEPIEPEASD